jgi:hypothetical protein
VIREVLPAFHAGCSDGRRGPCCPGFRPGLLGSDLGGGVGVAAGAVSPPPPNLQAEAALAADRPWDQVTAGAEEESEFVSGGGHGHHECKGHPKIYSVPTEGNVCDGVGTVAFFAGPLVKIPQWVATTIFIGCG